MAIDGPSIKGPGSKRSIHKIVRGSPKKCFKVSEILTYRLLQKRNESSSAAVIIKDSIVGHLIPDTKRVSPTFTTNALSGQLVKEKKNVVQILMHSYIRDTQRLYKKLSLVYRWIVIS